MMGAALDRALDRIERHARQVVPRVSKERARAYLNPRTRWQLDTIYGGCRFGSLALTECTPHEGLERLAWCLRQPSYGNRVALLNIRGARLAFRWLRRHERRADRERAAAIAAPFKLLSATLIGARP